MPRSDPSVAERTSAGRDGRVRLLVPIVATVGLFAAIMLASSLQGTPRFSAVPAATPDPVRPDTGEPTPTGSPAPVEELEDSLLITIVGFVVALLIGAAILTLLVVAVRMVIRLLVQLWKDRPLARRAGTMADLGPPTEAGLAAEPDSAAIRRGVADALHTIDLFAAPGDSIVAAWVALEETASDAGVGRQVNETPAEFTLRIIGRRSGISADTATLLELYERVRFGGHPADEHDRAVASRCLRGIEDGWR